MMDSQGQVSLEYLLIFSISLIIIIAFTLPLLENAMENTFDVSDSLKAKSDLSKIAFAIEKVYGQGQGSKQSVKLDVDNPVKITISNNYVSSKIKLKNGDYKSIRIDVNSKFKSQSFGLKKGMHRVVIQWPVDSEYMMISHD